MAGAIDDDPELESSPHSARYQKDGLVVDVLIYRIVGTDGWSLEVVDSSGTSTVWDDTFATDAEAHAVFMATIAEEGMLAFYGAEPGTKH
ncbi:hypothetical protein [Bosea sp. (in: a-proteobacteria)]|jgi:hypothetical protein|uniref:hypothetical protein n=1 Tax=Bosea sp. (in: a-proteobacteria) TaxID=1871050 RepID=UPI003F71E7ED